ncbi:hypothetical protein SAMN04488057_10437 [Cyclobacterium lianum]|uniref:6-bladed beta-propeller protein n=1 Tax=Cyclobacterium lianum TaxID=388280 RepID=A0A1M7M0Y6_9BACT|nr:hypothetical protein [Cyclobacterium lianum]SHM84196.1 hypothetical protein SAMN04488057_10437 [Cyclobacterium lianum]
MNYRSLLFLAILFSGLISCSTSREEHHEQTELEFVLVDSLVFDELQTLRILDYHAGKELYLMVTQGLEGRYFLIDSKGEVRAEEVLSEGPNAFGMVLHRAGFVGDELMFISDQEIFIYDLDLQQLRKFPFEQETMVRMIHAPLDNFNSFSLDNVPHGIANLSDRLLDKYPVDYFDTLNYFHLVNPADGAVVKGGKIDDSSIFKRGYFYPRKDKPVFFSDRHSEVLSLILPADSILFQFDTNLNLANKVRLERQQPDQLVRMPMAEAGKVAFNAYGKDILLGGSFTHIAGQGDSFIVEYKTGVDPENNHAGLSREEMEAVRASRKTYYYPIKSGKRIGKPIQWQKPGSLKLGLGNDRYLHYADQAEIHESEKEYQCYYIYELKEIQ